MGDRARALAATDAEAVVIGWLNTHPDVTAALGGSGRVSTLNEPPYPRVRVFQDGGDDRELLHLMVPRLSVWALGDLDGSPGKAALRRILYVVLGACAELPGQPVTDPAVPVVTHVTSGVGGGWSPLPDGQPRYGSGIAVYIHPPSQLPT